MAVQAASPTSTRRDSLDPDGGAPGHVPAASAADREPGGRPRVSWRANLVTALLGVVMSVGAALDGWAHGNLAVVDTFFTPWHGVLYAGYVLTAAWIGLQVVRCRRRGLRGLGAVPVGYGLGVVGALGFGVAGALDLLWHAVLGIEVGLEALLSPTHLLLSLANLLMVTSPLRAAWSDPESPRAPTFRALFPTLLSATLLMDVIAFMFLYELAFVPQFLETSGEAQVRLGIASVLTTNLILVGTMLLLLWRWRTPFGTFTFLFCYEAVVANAIASFAAFPTILTALVGGLAADVLIARLRPSPARAGAFRAVAGLTSLVLWSTYLLTARLVFGIDWSAPLWTGAIVLAVGTSVALAVLMIPPQAAGWPVEPVRGTPPARPPQPQ